jgi:DNA invertase Pin-like site-specific DNA recombinase
VEVIDDDLGRSGSGMRRPGFERLVAAICDGRVGAVLAIEVSRLARNGRDWHTLSRQSRNQTGWSRLRSVE